MRVEKMTMPVLFIGHGSPMNIIEENTWTRAWDDLSKRLPQPKGIIMISAHWFGSGLYVQADDEPYMIYDMYGFPPALYEYLYEAKNSTDLRSVIGKALPNSQAMEDRGYDHGAYSVLAHLYPKADVPLCQISIDLDMDNQGLFDIGEKLKDLRQEGYLIIGSGNVVHNLREAMMGVPPSPLATAFDESIYDLILQRDWEGLKEYERLEGASFSVPTTEHFLPLLMVAGASDETDQLEVINKEVMWHSLSMTSYVWWPKETN